jgi:hypothetical protein
MKIIKYIAILIVAVIIVVLIVKKMPSTPVATNTPGDSNTEILTEQVCYIWNTEAGDTAVLNMDISGTDVIGEFNWLPALKDKKTGMFNGTISGDSTNKIVNAIWSTSAEGMTAQEELKIIIEGDIAKVGFGEMKDNGSGVYVYANQNEISYAPSLQKTDCSDSAME